MSHWHDIGLIAPPAGQLVGLRRFPEGTPPYFGIFDYATALATSSVGRGTNIVTPWVVLAQWAPLSGSLGAWPAPLGSRQDWHDTFWTPPTDGQHIWLRRWGTSSAAVAATWTSATQAFHITGTTWEVPWYYTWKWKAR
jgi:hypothetical protein